MANESSYCSLDEFYASVPLDPAKKVIRVIDVHGSTYPMLANESLFASIRVIELDAEPTPRFATISYVWGSEATAESPSILLQHGRKICDFRLTRNCHEALVNLRAKLGPFTIWVDAICINQARDKEKTHQLNQMGEIYATSEVTYIWLGFATAKTEHALKVLTSSGLARHFFEDRDGEFSSRIRLRRMSAFAELFKQSFWAIVTILLYPIEVLQVLRASKSNLRGWLEMKHGISFPIESSHTVLETDWLHRMWTYQELILARQPVVVWGENHVPWSRLLAAVQYSRHVKQGSMHRRIGHETTLLDSWEELSADRERLRSTNGLSGSTSVISNETDLQRYNRFLFETSTYWLLILLALELSLIACLTAAVAATRTSAKRTSYGDWSIPIATILSVSFGMYLLFVSLWVGGKFMPSAFKSAHLGVLSALAWRKCKLPRDYNFAVRSILSSSSGRAWSSLEYTASLEEVNTNLCVELLRSINDPEIVRAAIYYPHRNGCPSWVVDWARFDMTYRHQSLWSAICSDASFSRERLKKHVSGVQDIEPSESDDSGEQAFFRYEPIKPDTLDLLSFNMGEAVCVPSFIAATLDTVEQDVEPHLRNLQTLGSILARCPARHVPHCLMSSVDRQFISMKKACELIASSESSPLEQLQELKTAKFFGIEPDVTMFETLHNALQAFLAGDIHVIILQPPCACGQCGELLGVSKGCASDQGGMIPMPGDKIIAVSQLKGFVIIRAKPSETDSEGQNYELISCCEIFGYNARRDHYKPGEYVHGLRVCPNLRSPIPVYTHIC